MEQDCIMHEVDYNEADTCINLINPKLFQAGWHESPHSLTRERPFTDGRIIVDQSGYRRGKKKIADYILRYRHDYPIAVVEAKRVGLPAGEGLQQAKEYAEILGLQFAYATNGNEIVEFDYTTGSLTNLHSFPTPDELWRRLQGEQQIDAEATEHVLEPFHPEISRKPRYYQEIAINRAVQAISKGNRRILLTMATGTGKTLVAFQICWKLWNSRWNRTREYRKPKILFLADRNILVDDPKDKTFTPFGDARFKIENGKISKGREMYFALYQALAETDISTGLYREYPPDFFDLIVIDECHRGSARDDSNWREILEYFEPAYQLGMTATPLREDNRNTYEYFGDPIYTYSLKQGIDDGFLAPYIVHRVVTSVDATGWRPKQGQHDRYGREIPDQEYTTNDFDRTLALRSRTQAIARHLSDFLVRSGNRYAKTIVFCTDQDHALSMLEAINEHNADLFQKHPDYACRVTSEEGDIGRGHLSRFQDPENETPVILTTSKLLTTGVDAPTVKNVVIANVVNSMTEFKQIIGRGTRVREDYGKLFFNIIDYTGSATKLFADPEFDGFPALITEEQIDDDGNVITHEDNPENEPVTGNVESPDLADRPLERRKLYVDDGYADIAAEMVYLLDEHGKQTMVKLVDYTAEQVRTLYPSSELMRQAWTDAQQRNQIVKMLSEHGVDFDQLGRVVNQLDADPFDLLCHVAFKAPILTRRERVERVTLEQSKFFEQYTSKARQILFLLLEKYAEYGPNQFDLGNVLKVQPFLDYGNVMEIAQCFGGPTELRKTVDRLQTLLYSA